MKEEKGFIIHEDDFTVEGRESELAALRAENAKLRWALVLVLKEGVGYTELNDIVHESLNSTTPDPLYSSAPEILKALEECLEFLEEGHLDVYINARRVIAKAKGETA